MLRQRSRQVVFLVPRAVRAVLRPLSNLIRGMVCRSVIHPLAFIGPRVHIGRGCTVGWCRLDTMNGRGEIHIGAGTIIYNAVEVLVHGGTVRIGRNCLITRASAIITGGHEFRYSDRLIQEQGTFARDVQVSDDCWIGYRAIVLGGVTVGEGAVVGAGAVLTRDVPAYAVVAGVPARLIGRRHGLRIKGSGRAAGTAPAV